MLNKFYLLESHWQLDFSQVYDVMPQLAILLHLCGHLKPVVKDNKLHVCAGSSVHFCVTGPSLFLLTSQWG